MLSTDTDDRAELACWLTEEAAPLTSYGDFDALTDAAECLALTSPHPMLSLRPHEGAFPGVELWLEEPVEALRPRFLDVRLNYTLFAMSLLGYETGPAADAAGLQAFAAEYGATQVRFTLTGLSGARAA